MCITYYGASHIAIVAHCAMAAFVHVLVLCISRIEKETEQIAGHRYPLCVSPHLLLCNVYFSALPTIVHWLLSKIGYSSAGCFCKTSSLSGVH